MPYASSVAALTLASDLSDPAGAVRLVPFHLDGRAHCCALLPMLAAAAVPQRAAFAAHRCKSARANGERHSFLPRIVALGRGTAQTQLRSVLQQCNVSKPFVVTDKNLEALTRSVLDSAEMSGEIYADEVDEPTSDRVDAWPRPCRAPARTAL